MPAPLNIAARRAMVEELRRQEPDISARQIAARLGVGKDTINRDLDAIREAQSQAAPEPAVTAPEPAPDAPQVAEDDAPHGPPGAPPAVQDDEPPDADRLTVPLDDRLRAGLAVLAQAGHTPEDAVRFAIAVLARAYEGAWKFGLYPRGTAPRVRYVKLHPYDPEGEAAGQIVLEHPRHAGKAAITAAIVDQAVEAGEHVHVAGRDGVRCAGGDPACSLPSKEPDR